MKETEKDGHLRIHIYIEKQKPKLKLPSTWAPKIFHYRH